MKIGLLKTLVCPTCSSGLEIRIKKKRKNEIEEGQLICSKCGEKFKISGGIPRFVIDSTKDFIRTEMAFSAKWKNHHKSHYAADWIRFQRKWFIDRLCKHFDDRNKKT